MQAYIAYEANKASGNRFIGELSPKEVFSIKKWLDVNLQLLFLFAHWQGYFALGIMSQNVSQITHM